MLVSRTTYADLRDFLVNPRALMSEPSTLTGSVAITFFKKVSDLFENTEVDPVVFGQERVIKPEKSEAETKIIEVALRTVLEDACETYLRMARDLIDGGNVKEISLLLQKLATFDELAILRITWQYAQLFKSGRLPKWSSLEGLQGAIVSAMGKPSYREVCKLLNDWVGEPAQDRADKHHIADAIKDFLADDDDVLEMTEQGIKTFPPCLKHPSMKPVKHLSLSSCEIEALDLTLFPDLVYLNLEEAEIDELDVTPVPQLKHLMASGSGIQRLDLRLLTQLEGLELDAMESLRELQLSPCPSLCHLTLGSGCNSDDVHIEPMGDLSWFPALKTLIYSGKFITLNLEAASNLEDLNVWDDERREIDLKHQQKLQAINFTDCELEELNIHPLPNLESIMLVRCRNMSSFPQAFFSLSRDLPKIERIDLIEMPWLFEESGCDPDGDTLLFLKAHEEDRQGIDALLTELGVAADLSFLTKPPLRFAKLLHTWLSHARPGKEIVERVIHAMQHGQLLEEIVWT